MDNPIVLLPEENQTQDTEQHEVKHKDVYKLGKVLLIAVPGDYDLNSKKHNW